MNTRKEKKRIRRQFIKNNVDIDKAEILEIGAFDNPTFSKDESRIYYCDYFSKDELSQNHIDSKPHRVAGAVDTDFVVKGNCFQEKINKKFDLVIANHVIEHTPNMIDWLQNISSILKERGALFLTIPHKEYTFDKMRQTTPLQALIRNYNDGLIVPSQYQIFDQLYFHRPFKAQSVWDNKHDHIFRKKRYKTVKDAWSEVERRLETTGYVDVHCNVFTHQSFIETVKDLYEADYIALSAQDSRDVVEPYNEFYALLSLATN